MRKWEIENMMRNDYRRSNAGWGKTSSVLKQHVMNNAHWEEVSITKVVEDKKLNIVIPQKYMTKNGLPKKKVREALKSNCFDVLVELGITVKEVI